MLGNEEFLNFFSTVKKMVRLLLRIAIAGVSHCSVGCSKDVSIGYWLRSYYFGTYSFSVSLLTREMGFTFVIIDWKSVIYA